MSALRRSGPLLVSASVALGVAGGSGPGSERPYEDAGASQRESVLGGPLLSARDNVVSMNLWLIPVDERSFQRTLAEPVDLSDWQGRPNEFPERARVWGVKTDPEQDSWERNRRNLERMELGDPLLVYRNSESRYTATGRVGPMTRTEHIRDEYWDAGPALHVYVVEEYNDSIDVEPEAVNNLLGYEESFWPQGLWRVADDRPTERVVRRFEV